MIRITNCSKSHLKNIGLARTIHPLIPRRSYHGHKKMEHNYLQFAKILNKSLQDPEVEPFEVEMKIRMMSHSTRTAALHRQASNLLKKIYYEEVSDLTKEDYPPYILDLINTYRGDCLESDEMYSMYDRFLAKDKTFKN